MVGRRRLLRRCRGSVAQAERVQMGGGGRWLLKSIPGGLEHRDGGVVKKAKNLNHDMMDGRKKEKRNERQAGKNERNERKKENMEEGRNKRIYKERVK